MKLNLHRCEGAVRVPRRVSEAACRQLKYDNDHGKVWQHAMYDAKRDRCYLCESFVTGAAASQLGRVGRRRTSRESRQMYDGDLRYHSLSAERGTYGGDAIGAMAVAGIAGATVGCAIVATMMMMMLAARRRAAARRVMVGSADATRAMIESGEQKDTSACVDV